jgi:hypothetical protein
MQDLLSPGFIGQSIQTLVLLIGFFVAIGAAKQEIRNQALLLNKIDSRVDRLETAFIQWARLEERMNSLDSRQLAQGKRIDYIQYASRQTQEEN